MADSIAELIALSDCEDPYNLPWAELEPLWIDAIDRRFQACRGRIRVLDQLAEHCCLIARARANIEGSLRFGCHTDLAHDGHDVGLRDGLAM